MFQSIQATHQLQPPVVEVASDPAQPKSAKRPHLVTTGAGDVPLTDRQIKKRKLYQELTQALEWKQKSAAYKALCIQTFAFAERALEQKLAKLTPSSDETVGLVLDVDDCLLECSPFFGGMVNTDEQMTMGRSLEWWKKGQREMSTVMEGALEFVKKYANDKRVKITFLTSRTKNPNLKQWTKETLQYFGFPANDDNLIIAHREKGHSKPDHIQKIREDNKDILTMGDKLSDAGEDMPEGPAKWVHSPETMKKLGRDHIVIPNPLYGYWERITHKTDFDIDAEIEQRSKELKINNVDFDGDPDENKTRESLQSLHYIQSASYDAYVIQLTNIANDILDEYKGGSEEAGAIIDIDGTLLSNDQYMAPLLIKGQIKPSHKTLSQLVKGDSGRPIIGMQSVVKKIRERRINICFVTNRKQRVTPEDATETLRDYTRNELIGKGFMMNGDTLLMKEDYNADSGSNKSSRIAAARQTLSPKAPLRMELIFGDAMNDLDIDPVLMHESTLKSWSEELQKQLKTLGQTRFLLPNPLHMSGWKKQLTKWQNTKEQQLSEADPTFDPVQLRKIRCWCPQEMNIPTVVAA